MFFALFFSSCVSEAEKESHGKYNKLTAFQIFELNENIKI